jgi:hypothetical protein
MELTTTSDYVSPPELALEEHQVISPTRFVVLCLATIGLYNMWWQYKTWRFFKQRQQSDIWPVARALFSIFTVHELMTTIGKFARSNGIEPTYNPRELTGGYVILSLLSRLPSGFGLISLASFAFLMAPFKAFRSALLASPEYAATEQTGISTGQLVAFILGPILWSVVLIGILAPE